jgi:hypothetical protein
MFLAELNQDIDDAFRKKSGDPAPAHAKLTLDEVLSVRLYTGPGFQPLNDFLRQVTAPHAPGAWRALLWM